MEMFERAHGIIRVEHVSLIIVSILGGPRVCWRMPKPQRYLDPVVYDENVKVAHHVTGPRSFAHVIEHAICIVIGGKYHVFLIITARVRDTSMFIECSKTKYALCH
ncbi:hypothetical protein Hanom_Chr06g00520371 [Helianthus anomalus]